MTPRRGAVAVVREAFSRFRDDEMTDSAAALTYYALLSLFPALLVGASMFGLLGQTHAIDQITRYLTNHGAEGSTVDAVRSSLRTAQSSRGGAGIGLVLGIALSMYGASGAFAAAGRALNRVMRVDEGRGPSSGARRWTSSARWSRSWSGSSRSCSCSSAVAWRASCSARSASAPRQPTCGTSCAGPPRSWWP